MTQKKYNHIHKLRRDRYSTGRPFYYCINDCTFKIDIKQCLGKVVLCNKCGKEFEMNEYSIRAAKPICMECIARRKALNNPNINLDSIIGVVDANLLDRNSQSQSTNEVHSNSIESLQSKLRNITIKEYNPEDEDDVL